MSLKYIIFFWMLTANYSSVLSLEYSKGFNESDAINTIHTGHNKRTSKFLFDTIFRISSGVSNAFGLSDTEDEVEYTENSSLKNCDCGMCMCCLLLIFKLM